MKALLKRIFFILLARIIGILFNVSLLDNYSFSSDFFTRTESQYISG